MKRKLFLMMLSMVTSIAAWSADGDTFTLNTVEGVEMTFKVISEEEKTCQVGVGLGMNVTPSISNETTGQITIPLEAKGYIVTTIAVNAFYNCSGITNINIPSSITYIGSNALEGTQWYNEQPEGLVYLGNLLYKWKGTIPSNTSVDIKGGTVAIAERAFDKQSNLYSVTIPQSVVTIGSDAFSACTRLNNVIFSNGLENIGSNAFYGCTSLSAIELPNSVKSIGSYAFSGCI